MVPLNRPLSPNVEAVAAEVLEGEAIIIDLTTGVYYSMDGVGGSLWASIEAGLTVEDIVAAIVGRYEVSREQAQTDVQEVVAHLLREGLIVAAEGNRPAPTDQEPSSGGKLPYETPRLKTYRDMGDLLALDPPVPGLQDIPWKVSAE